MATQEQPMSNFAKRLGARVAAANAEHKDKPVDTGNRRLPGGIRNGIAKLSSLYTKQQTEGNADDKIPPGADFFRASAVVVSPETFNGEKVAGLVTSVVIPLCDVPAKGQRKAKSFEENWYEFQNFFKLLGVQPPNETAQSDPTGEKTTAYYHAVMRALLANPQKPVYISFSTRSWKPPATPAQPNPEEMVFETWHGLAEMTAGANPAGGVADRTPPTGNGVAAQPPAPAPVLPQTAAQGTAVPPSKEDGREETVAALVPIALADPNGDTEDGNEACATLEDMALSNGWTEADLEKAADWAAVGEMALNKPPTAPPTLSVNGTPAIGAHFLFAKRGPNGDRLADKDGNPFAAQEYEVVAVDNANRTVHLKGKDGKPLVNLRGKKPVEVKWEWLEPLAY